MLDWKHITLIALGIGCVVSSALVPATAPFLAPLAVPLLLYADPKKAAGLVPSPAAAPDANISPRR